MILSLKFVIYIAVKRWPEVIVRALREEGFEVAYNVEGFRAGVSIISKN